MLMIHCEPMSDFSWQNPGKRTAVDYQLAPDPTQQPGEFARFWSWVEQTAIQLAPAAETLVSHAAIKGVLAQWCRVLPSEAASWAKKGAPNDPIFDKAVWDDRKLHGRPAEVRIYDSVVDLLLAIIGHIRSREKLTAEGLLAARVLQSQKTNLLVQGACAAVIAAMSKGVKGAPNDYILGEYQTLHRQPGYDAWVASYKTLKVHINIEVLHDIARQYDTVEKWPDSWAEPPKTASQVQLAQHKRLADERGFTSKSTMRHNVGTVNEDTRWAERARFHDLPVWAGPSGTAKMLCQMLSVVGKVTPDEMLACVYALFALWASDHYPKTSTPIHHLHEVMAGAKEYFGGGHSIGCQPKQVVMWLEAFLAPAPVVHRVAISKL